MSSNNPSRLVVSIMLTTVSTVALTATPSSRRAQELLDIGQCQKAHDEAIPLANKGNSEAQFIVAQAILGRSETTEKHCQKGESKPGSTLEGIEWATKSAKNNYAPAMVYIGSRLIVDLRTSKSWQFEYNPQLGIKLLKGAEKQGNIMALDKLGAAYAHGNGVPIDMRMAFQYFDRYEEKSGKDSENKKRVVAQETATRIGTEVCWGNPYGRNTILDLTDGRKVSIRGTITARSDNFYSVGAKVSSIIIFDELGRRFSAENFTLANTTLVVGRETWNDTEWTKCRD